MKMELLLTFRSVELPFASLKCLILLLLLLLLVVKMLPPHMHLLLVAMEFVEPAMEYFWFGVELVRASAEPFLSIFHAKQGIRNCFADRWSGIDRNNIQVCLELHLPPLPPCNAHDLVGFNTA